MGLQLHEWKCMFAHSVIVHVHMTRLCAAYCDWKIKMGHRMSKKQYILKVPCYARFTLPMFSNNNVSGLSMNCLEMSILYFFCLLCVSENEG